MPVLPQLLLLQKTLLNIEGIGRQLYPELDLWAAARPSMEEFMRERSSVKRFGSAVASNVHRWVDHLPELPEMLFDVVDQVRSGKLKVGLDDYREIELARKNLREAERRTQLLLFSLGLLFTACILTASGRTLFFFFGPLPLEALAMLATGVFLGLLAFKKTK